MDNLPTKALSIRQPWAWAILNAGKRVENRPRRFHYRGPICLHASSYDPKSTDYDDCHFVMDTIWGNFTHFQMVKKRSRTASMYNSSDGKSRGGIIGTAEIVDCIEQSDDPWFFGPFGLVLENVQSVDFIAVKGALGLFDWRKRL